VSTPFLAAHRRGEADVSFLLFLEIRCRRGYVKQALLTTLGSVNNANHGISCVVEGVPLGWFATIESCTRIYCPLVAIVHERI